MKGFGLFRIFSCQLSHPIHYLTLMTHDTKGTVGTSTRTYVCTIHTNYRTFISAKSDQVRVSDPFPIPILTIDRRTRTHHTSSSCSLVYTFHIYSIKHHFSFSWNIFSFNDRIVYPVISIYHGSSVFHHFLYSNFLLGSFPLPLWQRPNVRLPLRRRVYVSPSSDSVFGFQQRSSFQATC